MPKEPPSIYEQLEQAERFVKVTGIWTIRIIVISTICFCALLYFTCHIPREDWCGRTRPTGCIETTQLSRITPSEGAMCSCTDYEGNFRMWRTQPLRTR